ncbi:MAG: SUMF1/EgtB/PvdO family nonheme iron enzyme, partial [Anaerolineales bacterium]|nr:SUMF1/EgtB/PvdO family nonheme iron enzyme [Anaerolineales bacterium]
DIKPANIMLDQQGHIYLADFGIAQIVGSSRLTQSGMTTGTPAFMAPEQVRGEAVTTAADIYALGVILYHMVTGQYPHRGDSPLTVMMSKVAEPPTPPTQFTPDLPLAIETIILTALAQQAEDRFADAATMAAALRQAVGGEDVAPATLLSTTPALTQNTPVAGTVAAKTAVSPTTPPTTSHTPTWVWGIMAVAAVALVAVGFLLARGTNSSRTVTPTGETAVAAVTDGETAVAATPIPLPSLPGMTFIPAGSFVMGSDSGNADEAPPHPVSLDAYFLDTTEVTNAEYAAFIADTGHTAPTSWRQPDPSIWAVTATEPYVVGSVDDHFSYDGALVQPVTGVLTMTVNADTDEGLIVAVFNGRIQPSSDEEVYEGTFRIEQDFFFDGPPFPAFKEGGLGDFVHMHGLSGQELSLYPEMTAYIGTWGLADLYLDDNLLYGGLGIHVMYSDGVRQDGTNQILRADGTCCFSAAAPGDGFVNPAEQEISIWLFTAVDYEDAEDFWINVYYNDVTVQSAPEFTGPSLFPDGLEDYPVTQVTWEDAAAYCSWREARLPTEAEWEYAARGESGQIYPWGNEKGTVQANIDNRLSGPAPVGSFAEAASPFGIQDMAGNVWEWTADWYDATYYQRASAENPAGPTRGTDRVLRGGGFRILDFLGQDEARATHRRALLPDQAADDIGFRCAANP